MDYPNDLPESARYAAGALFSGGTGAKPGRISRRFPTSRILPRALDHGDGPSPRLIQDSMNKNQLLAACRIST